MSILSALSALVGGYSFRGIPFSVERGTGEHGRRVAIHEFPYSEAPPFVEDLGLDGKDFAIEGWLVGDDADDRLQALIKAAETKGSAPLVHPILGTITVTLTQRLKYQFDTSKRFARFSLAGVQTKPVPATSAVASNTNTVNTAAGVTTAANTADTATSTSFLGSVGAEVASVKSSVSGVITNIKSTIAPYVADLTTAIGDARSVFGAVKGVVSTGQSIYGSVESLSTTFGRFSGGSTSGAFGLTSISSAISAASSAQASVTRIAGGVSKIASLL